MITGFVAEPYAPRLLFEQVLFADEDAVDDTIHFMHDFRRAFNQLADACAAVRAMLESTGQALFFMSLVLASEFFIYMLASMKNLFFSGLLTGVAIAVAFLPT
jgi:hypothetical protein